MTVLGVYVMFVLPVIALLMAWGADRLVKADYDRLEKRSQAGGASRPADHAP